MPDQIPSALWDSVNSFDSIFALDLDTKQRFDNILTGVQKPIDYPIPDFNKDFQPQGLPQNDLLNPNLMKGTVGNALFSQDPKVAAYATDRLLQKQSRLPVTQGVGVPDRFQYDKMMDKYIKGDFGYNPYQSIEDNEDFNYRYDYLNQSLFERITKNIGTGVSRFLGSVVLKLGQTAGYMGSMIGNGIEEIFNAKDNNFMADVADNSLSRWFEGLETDMKNSNLLSVFKPRNWEDRGFFNKLGHGAFWTDEVADGAAFMGEMVASMYMLGGLGKIGALGRLGSTEINLASRFGTTGKVVDGILKTATGANNISGIGRWGFSVASESAFEASGLYQQRKEELRRERDAGINNFSDAEIDRISGDSAAASYKANMLILSASNAFENKMIFSPIFNRLKNKTPNPKSRLVDISNSTDKIDDIAKASRKTYNYSTWVGKKLDWKNSNSRLRFYGSKGLSAIGMEGFWEENAQLAAERLASTDNLSVSSFLNKILSQTGGALGGDDPEAATSIGLGAVIGGGGVTAVSKIRGGDKLFQGERRRAELSTLSAINTYNEFRQKFLNFQDIYVRDKNGKPVLDTDGNLEIDEVKAIGLLEGLNKFTSKQAAIEQIGDPLLRKHLQDDAVGDFVFAAKSAGVYDRALKTFENLESLDQEQLMNLGFDPNTTVDTSHLKDSIKKMGEFYDETMNEPAARRGKDDTLADERNRKVNLYKARGREYSARKLSEEYRTRMMETDYPSAFSEEAIDQDSALQEYNSLIYKRRKLNQFKEFAEENSPFYNPYIVEEEERMASEQSRLLRLLFPKIKNKALVGTFEGFLMSRGRFRKLFGKEPTFMRPVELTEIEDPATSKEYFTLKDVGYDEAMFNKLAGSEANRRQAGILFDIESSAQAKYAELDSVASKNKYLSDKLRNPENGLNNYKEYIAFVAAVQKKDEAADAKETKPAPETVATPEAATSQVATAPAATVVSSEPAPKIEKQDVVNSAEFLGKLNSLFVDAYSNFISRKEGEEPEVYSDLIDFINGNYPALEKEIKFYIQRDFVDKFFTPFKDKLSNRTFDPRNDDDGLLLKDYQDSVNFLINELGLNGLHEGLYNWISSQADQIDTILDEYEGPIEQPQVQPPVILPPIKQPEKENVPVSTNELEQKEADIERRRQEDLKKAEAWVADDENHQEGDFYEYEGVKHYVDTTLYDAIDDKYDAELAALKGPVEKAPELEEIPVFNVGDYVQVLTGKDGTSRVKEDRGDKVLLIDGRQVMKKNLRKLEGPPTEEGPIEPPPPPPLPPTPPAGPPIPPQNSDSETQDSENKLDPWVDGARKDGIFTFVQDFLAEVIADRKGVPVLVDGAIQLKSISGDQADQLVRTHNVLKRMSMKNRKINFWTTEMDDKPMFRIKLMFGTSANEAKYSSWIYNVTKGKLNDQGKPYPFPFIIAVITDNEGNPQYFTQEGELTDEANGLPVAFSYSVQEYLSKNLNTSRRGIFTKTREPLNGLHGYENDNPLGDMSEAVKAGIPIFGDIIEVTAGKLSSSNATNSPSVQLRSTYKLRTVKEILESGDVDSKSPIVLEAGNFFEYNEELDGTQRQQVKVGQPFLFDKKNGIHIPLRGRKLRDLTLNGKPIISEKLKKAMEVLQKDRELTLDPNASTQEIEDFNSLAIFLRAIVYSKNISIVKVKGEDKIEYRSIRPDETDLLDEELNFSTGIEIIQLPFSDQEVSYDDLVAENFLSGVVPVEVEKGVKRIEKVNKRIVFTLDKSHQEILEALGSRPNKKSIRITPTDMNKFVGKSYRKRGGRTTVTVKSYNDGIFTVVGEGGREVTQSREDFMKSLNSLEEVILPIPSEETKEEFVERKKLSKEEIKEQIEKSKTASTDDLKKDMDLGCE